MDDAQFAELEAEYENRREDFFVVCQAQTSEDCLSKKAQDGKILLQISKKDFYDWRDGGKFAQDAFPYLTPGERELLISHTCDTCFNKLFPPEDEDQQWPNEPDVPDYDPGPEVDDEGGMSEHRGLDPEIFPDGGYTA